jgi:hypothetical protein
VVRTRFSAVGRGTETLVFRGGVPASQYAHGAPFQVGEFPAPVEYGYLNVGEVDRARGAGRRPCSVSPHRTRYVVPAGAVTGPGRRSAARAVLAAPSRPRSTPLGRRPLVGTGSPWSAADGGCCVAALLPASPVRCSGRRRPGAASIAAALGVGFAAPADAAGDCDLVVHASATDAGALALIGAAGRRGRGARLSWYGDRPARCRSGGFHSRADDPREPGRHRLPPGAGAAYADRMALALRLLCRSGV